MVAGTVIVAFGGASGLVIHRRRIYKAISARMILAVNCLHKRKIQWLLNVRFRSSSLMPPAGISPARLRLASKKVVCALLACSDQHDPRTGRGFLGAVHKERPFFNDLVAFMTSGPVVVQVLEGENAVVRNREIMGATNPADAAEGTIRKDFAESIEANSVHGSDSPENAKIEIDFFFAADEITG